MTPRFSAVAACAGVLICFPLAIRAQQSTAAPVPVSAPSPSNVAPAAFSYELGRATVHAGEAQLTYAVLATQPLASKGTGQRIRLQLEGTGPGGTSHHTLVINTGKFKTVRQMGVLVADIFQRFLAGPVTAGQEFGKVGDVRYGGEIRFVASSPDQLGYKIIIPGSPDNGGEWTRADVQAFINIFNALPRS